MRRGLAALGAEEYSHISRLGAQTHPLGSAWPTLTASRKVAYAGTECAAVACVLRSGYQNPCKSALSELQDTPGNRVGRYVEGVSGHGLAVELDPALSQRAASLRGGDAEGLREQRGDVHDVLCRNELDVG